MSDDGYERHTEPSAGGITSAGLSLDNVKTPTFDENVGI